MDYLMPKQLQDYTIHKTKDSDLSLDHLPNKLILEVQLQMDPQKVFFNGILQLQYQHHYLVHTQEWVHRLILNMRVTMTNHYKQFWTQTPNLASMILRKKGSDLSHR
jgi:hypothetical protein